MGTVTGERAQAMVAPAAAEVDFPYNALIDEFLRSFNDRADKFVARDTSETHVAFKDLQIRGADAGEMNFDQSGLIVTGVEAIARRLGDLRFSILDLGFLRRGIG